MASPVVHFEIASTDPAGTKRFVAEMFGWKLEEIPGPFDYSMVDTGEEERFAAASEGRRRARVTPPFTSRSMKSRRRLTRPRSLEVRASWARRRSPAAARSG